MLTGNDCLRKEKKQVRRKLGEGLLGLLLELFSFSHPARSGASAERFSVAASTSQWPSPNALVLYRDRHAADQTGQGRSELSNRVRVPYVKLNACLHILTPHHQIANQAYLPMSMGSLLFMASTEQTLDGEPSSNCRRNF
jgi:hypothetical protein